MKGVRYVSLQENSGYGEAARRVMRGLVAAGVPITWTPMRPGAGWALGYEPIFERHVDNAGDLADFCNASIDYDTLIIHTVPEYYPLWRLQLAREGAHEVLVLGHTVWETTSLPAAWPPLLREVDGILVPSEWNREVFAGAGVDRPIALLPHPCLEPGRRVPRPPRRPDEPFRFYTVNTWTQRKALGRLIRAYLSAFSADDPVELVIKTSPQDFTRKRGRMARRFLGPHLARNALDAMVAAHPRPAAIRLITDPLTDGEIDHLHASGDCYVSLCRSEGWGIGAFDAACYGNPVVITGFGGQLEYLQDDALLVEHELVPVHDPNGGASYTCDQMWAEPNIEHAAACLRKVAGEPETARRRSKRLAARIQANYSGEAVVRDLLPRIERIRYQGAAAL